MTSVLRILALALLLASLGLWQHHGFRLGFWQTSVQVETEVPIIEEMPELGTQRKIEWKNQFVSGIETPLAGLLAFLALMILAQTLKRRLKKREN